MTPERWRKIKALFSSAQECPEGERDHFLSRECGNDEELRRDVEKLLDSARSGDAFLEDSAIVDPSLFESDHTARMEISVSDEPPHLSNDAVLNERYKIIRLLGRGGMGEVYLAKDMRLQRNVAIKVLHAELVSSKEGLRRFALEAQAVSALNHPHIMTVYEFDTTADGTLFFVAEYVDGQTLNRLIGDGIALDKALDIAIQVSSALSAAHEAGITHRDIKPENIMIRADGYVKVLDFGLAKLTWRPQEAANNESDALTETLRRTRPGAVMGTAAYMSPEQARGLNVDARTDIWSLGAVIYEMLTGRRPFLGGTSADIMVSVLLREPLPVSAHFKAVPAELDWIVAKALSKDVESRYQTGKEIRADLEKIRKRVEFDDTLDRSGVIEVEDATPKAEKPTAASPEPGIATDVDPARPTSAGRGERTAPSSVAPSPGAPNVLGLTYKLAFGVIALALFGMVSYAIYYRAMPPASSGAIDSIAVLPLEVIGGNGDLAYASDGVSEALIDRLSQLPQLKVISRSSSFKFRGSNLDLREIASKLDVRAVVTGSITRVDDELSIRIDIVDAVENRHLAGGQYRRKADDLLGIPKEIAHAATEQLKVRLTDSQSRRLKENLTDSSEAFNYYLSGLVALNGPADGRGPALEYFEHAIKLDPDFAAAHTEVAWAYYSRANASDDPSELMPKARAATERALRLDPDLAKAHAMQAMMHEYAFEWEAAEREYKRAIELSPNQDFARNNYGFLLSVLDRQTEALAQLEEQRLRDPINRRLGLLHKAIVLVQARRFDEALETYREAQAVEPSRNVPDFALGYAYAGKGLYGEAVGYYKKSVASLGGEEKYSQPLVYLAVAYAKMPEKRREAQAILTRIEATNRYASPALLAAVYLALGNNDKALELLEQAYVKRDILLRFVGVAYEYDSLRSDPRFIDLTQRIGLAR